MPIKHSPFFCGKSPKSRYMFQYGLRAYISALWLSTKCAYFTIVFILPGGRPDRFVVRSQSENSVLYDKSYDLLFELGREIGKDTYWQLSGISKKN